jgi:hypothetical protein
MTVNCFKKLCLKARTDKADQIHDYYIKLENIINETVYEQAEEFSRQLQIKDNMIKNISYKQEQDLLLKYDNRRCLYICGIKEGDKITIGKFGITSNICQRFQTHKKEISTDLVLLHVLESVYNTVIENKIKELCNHPGDMLYGKRITRTYNDKIQTELIQFDDDFTHEKFWLKVLNIEKSLNKDEIFLQMETKIEMYEVEISKLRLEHQSIIAKKENQIAKLNRLHVLDEIHYPVTAYLINTKQEVVFQSTGEVQHYFNVCSNTLKNYIDKRRHLNGAILRSRKYDYYWAVPDNFKFCEFVKPTTQNIFIKSVNKTTGEVIYYNSITEASLYLQNQLDEKEIVGETEESLLIKKALSELLRGIPTRKKIINEYTWYKMRDIGYIVNANGTRNDIEQAESTVTDENAEDIIVKDITTGIERVHKSTDDFFAIYKLNDLSKYINKPMNFRQYTFRTNGQPIWEPPDKYMHDPERKSTMEFYVIKVENKATGLILYSDSVRYVLKHIFPELTVDEIKTLYNTVHKNLNKNSVYDAEKMTRCKDYVFTKYEKYGKLIKGDDVEIIN